MNSQQKQPDCMFTTGYIPLVATGVVILIAIVLTSVAALLLAPILGDATILTGATLQLVFLSVIPATLIFCKNDIADTFGLKRAVPGTALKWTFIFIAYIGVFMVVLFLLDRKEGVEAMLEHWKNCKGIFRALFIFNVVILAPLGEEVLFRGYLFYGLSHSKAGPVVGAIVSTAVWTLLHSQYPWPELVGLFLMGMLLCAVRYKTKSLWLAIGLHMINNILGALTLWAEA